MAQGKGRGTDRGVRHDADHGGGRRCRVTLTRKAHLHLDGTLEVTVEEDWVWLWRYVEGAPGSAAREDDKAEDRGEEGRGRGLDGSGRGLRREAPFTLVNLFKSCLAPCASIADMSPEVCSAQGETGTFEALAPSGARSGVTRPAASTSAKHTKSFV